MSCCLCVLSIRMTCFVIFSTFPCTRQFATQLRHICGTTPCPCCSSWFLPVLFLIAMFYHCILIAMLVLLLVQAFREDDGSNSIKPYRDRVKTLGKWTVSDTSSQILNRAHPCNSVETVRVWKRGSVHAVVACRHSFHLKTHPAELDSNVDTCYRQYMFSSRGRSLEKCDSCSVVSHRCFSQLCLTVVRCFLFFACEYLCGFCFQFRS
jgi:hypothetical protein